MKRAIERYEVIGSREINGSSVPVLDIPQMTDDEWNKKSSELAVIHFCQRHGREPEDLQEALDDERAFILSL